LQAQNAFVMVAGNQLQIDYLQQEVTNVTYILLKGYDVKYAKTKLGLIFRLIVQVPKLFSIIFHEHYWLQIIIKTRKIDGVISDNRYGLFTKIVPCIFITHQLCIQVPMGKSIVHRMNQYFINQYNSCWVPDVDGENNMSGDLSNANDYINTKKIGILSRFSGVIISNNKIAKNTILCILSGPEPQRSMLLEMLEKQIKSTNYTLTIVGDDNADNRKPNPQIYYHNIADTHKLQTYIQSHQYIITRSGYSSLMDLHCLGRNAIIIPTPGQTEQEYLAEYLMKKKWHYALTQNKFDLQNSINEFDKMHFAKFHIENQNKLATSVSEFLESC
jgi:Glycosyltransferase family 28 C-terminal domain